MKQQSRREFVKKVVLASLGLYFLPYCKKENIDNGNNKIIIIGAGIAGLSAAYYLKNKGYNVNILEASNRYGGRIMTVNIDGYKADFGASWIHGINGNPLFELSEEHNIKTRPTFYEPSYIFDVNGEQITYQEWEIIEGLLEDLVNLAYDNSDISLQELLVLMEPNLVDLSDKLRRTFYGAVRSEIEIPYAVDASEISAKALTTNDSFTGDDVIFVNGMEKLTNLLAENQNIQYNTFVTKISYSGDKINVYTKNPNSIDNKRSCKACHSDSEAYLLEHDDVISADRVIVALPLGMLKNNNVIFEPQLPNSKINAINSIGIGTMNKVFLRFNENFWNKDGYFFEYLKNDYSKVIEFFSPTPTGTENVIVAVFAGQQARSIEKMDLTSLTDLVMNDLKGMFGNDIPQPIDIQKTTWHTNKFSLGAYPHLLPGADLSACKEIAKNLNNRVFFAGDATSRDYMATAHGAYISGINAAKEIIDSF